VRARRPPSARARPAGGHKKLKIDRFKKMKNQKQKYKRVYSAGIFRFPPARSFSSACARFFSSRAAFSSSFCLNFSRCFRSRSSFLIISSSCLSSFSSFCRSSFASGLSFALCSVDWSDTGQYKCVQSDTRVENASRGTRFRANVLRHITHQCSMTLNASRCH
jgi:hypothetical protein